MSNSREEAKRLQVTIIDFLTLIVGVSISLGLMRMSVTLHFVRPHTDTGLLLLGLVILPASIGAFLGKLMTGTYRGAGAGAFYGCFALLVIGCITGLLINASR